MVSNMEVEKYEINPGHYLELMDRLHVVNSTIEDHMYSHPLTNTLPEVKLLIGEAQMKLMKAYQIVGSREV
jgi:hypothetical protein